MIAGPNGAGKTTTTLEVMNKGPDIYEFINADEIARGLAPLHPESMALTASKLMIERLRDLLANGKNFAFETTASGTNYVKHLQLAKKEDYEVHLVFLWLSSPQQAIRRVAQRVKQGGHNVTEDTIVRRYFTGLKNFLTLYLPLADTAIILDNSSEKRKLIARKRNSSSIDILETEKWKQIESMASGR